MIHKWLYWHGEKVLGEKVPVYARCYVNFNRKKTKEFRIIVI